VTAPNEKPNAQGLARRRLLACSAAFAAATAISALLGAPRSVAFLYGWDAFTLVFLVWVWSTIWPADADRTAKHALAEDDSRTASDLVLIGASLVSLVAIGFTLAEATKSSGAHSVYLAAVAVVSIALGWAAIHTTFTLMYARLFYGEPKGGIKFDDSEPPDFRDFAYVAFTIGMTYQVSDTDVTQKRIRRIIVRHALLSFVFGTAIIAVAINVVANLVNR
jgi:uncharacterized membrane protein